MEDLPLLIPLRPHVQRGFISEHATAIAILKSRLIVMNILELPEDILSIIFLHLDPLSFLFLCQSSKTLYNQYRQDSIFWRTKTSDTFRIPVSPLLKADGARWYWLYKRLKTQTKLYTWGQGLKGNLGPGRGLRHPRVGGLRGPHRLPPRVVFQRVSSTWPTETHIPDDVGVIADLQCGGWSTSILSSRGKLYTTGSINSTDNMTIGQSSHGFHRLEYLTESTSAIKQFSAGRAHILALTDDAEILSWDRINAKGLKVFSRDGRDFGGKPKRVVAGWANSAAYTPEAGIVYWTPLKNDQTDDTLDGIHIQEKVVPGTARQVLDGDKVHEVLAFVVLERFIVWVTSNSKVWACDMTSEEEDRGPKFPPFEIPGFNDDEDQLSDIQGSFRNFVVFTSSGRVLAGNKDFLNSCYEKAHAHSSRDVEGKITSASPSSWSELEELLSTRPKDIPALQHNNVIAVAFGDYHYHALHSNGSVTSYGNEPQGCGTLGLGEVNQGGRFRGLTGHGVSDLTLLPIANLRGRQVWFEPEKKDWLAWLLQRASKDTQDGNNPIIDLLNHPDTQAMVSEWVEQEGRHWSEGPSTISTSSSTSKNLNVKTAEDYNQLGAYFSIAISAAGWHSGALVLVDEHEAENNRQKWTTTLTTQEIEEDEHTKAMPGHFEAPKAEPEEVYIWNHEEFPRFELPNGQQTRTSGDIQPWKAGMPSMSDMGLEQH